MNLQMKAVPVQESQGYLHCPICTHTVQGVIVTKGKNSKVKPGQKCSRCSAALDPAYILRYDQAA